MHCGTFTDSQHVGNKCTKLKFRDFNLGVISEEEWKYKEFLEKARLEVFHPIRFEIAAFD